jgi:multidrug resistance efflux pump
MQAAYQMAQAQARQAEAQLKEARSERRRAESMAEQALISKADLDTATTRAESAQAALELANMPGWSSPRPTWMNRSKFCPRP